MSETPDTVLIYTTVQTWLQSLQQHGPLAPADRQERLQTLAAFCEYVGQTPDAIIAGCLRETPAGTAIWISGRRHYAEQIDAFQQQVPGDHRHQVQCGSILRSFLIHNGVMLQTGWQYRPQR
jgi:hypothetical protein